MNNFSYSWSRMSNMVYNRIHTYGNVLVFCSHYRGLIKFDFLYSREYNVSNTLDWITSWSYMSCFSVFSELVFYHSLIYVLLTKVTCVHSAIAHILLLWICLDLQVLEPEKLGKLLVISCQMLEQYLFEPNLINHVSQLDNCYYYTAATNVLNRQ